MLIALRKGNPHAIEATLWMDLTCPLVVAIQIFCGEELLCASAFRRERWQLDRDGSVVSSVAAAINNASLVLRNSREKFCVVGESWEGIKEYQWKGKDD
jgi:hypothetical protein